jgi:hypothetical protein
MYDFCSFNRGVGLIYLDEGMYLFMNVSKASAKSLARPDLLR